MINQLFLILLLLLCSLWQLQASLKKGDNKFISSTFDLNTSPLVIKIPIKSIPTVQEFGFAFWIRWSHFKPKFVSPAWLRDKWIGVAGVTERENWEQKKKLGAQSLATWLLPANNITKFHPTFHMKTYNLNDEEPEEDDHIYDLDIPEDDFYEGWVFMYQAYSYKEKEVFRYILTSRTGYNTSSIQKQVMHQDPLQNLKFTLGPGKEGLPAWNGQYYNVEFFYGNGNPTLYLNTPNAVYQLVNDKQNAPNMPLWIGKTVTYELIQAEKFREVSDPPLKKILLKSQTDQTEYGYWGWLKFQFPKAMDNQESIFHVARLAQHNEESLQNQQKAGDRTLLTILGKQYYEFSTYTQQFRANEDDWNVQKTIELGQDTSLITNWHFIYFAYSREERKAFVFLHFSNDIEKKLRFSNIGHLVPYSHYFNLGKDKFYKQGFNGYLNNWCLQFGRDTYREKNFKDLYDRIPSKFSNVILEEPAQPKPVLQESQWTGPQIQTIDVPKDDLKIINNYSFSMWVRFSFTTPKSFADIETLRNQQIGVASITENLNSCSSGFGDRALSVWTQDWNAGLGFVFSTYNLQKNTGNQIKIMKSQEFEEFDGVWIWLYYGFSLQQDQSFGYGYFSESQSAYTIQQDGVRHENPPKALKFIAGRCWEPYTQFIGHYFNIQFFYKGQNFLSNQAQVEQYFSSVTHPDKLLPLKTVLLKKDFEGLIKQDSKENIQKKIDVDAIGAEDYAVYGWAKLNPTNQEFQQVFSLFRLTNYQNGQENINFKVGDQTMCAQLERNQIQFGTYTFGLQGGEVTDLKQSIKYDDISDLEKWFFIYFGYSHEQMQAFAFVKLDDRMKHIYFQGVRHFKPYYLRLYIGKDPFFWSFNGESKGWILAYGRGAYQTRNIDLLYNVHNDVKSPLISDEWKYEAKLESTTYDQKQELARNAVQDEDLRNNIAYSFSLWVKFSYNNPIKMPIQLVQQNYLGIAGFSEKEEGFCNWEQMQSRTLSLFYRAYKASPTPTYHFTLYDLGKNNSNYYQNMEFQRQNHDSEWNWIYFGYSNKEKKALAYVYFSSLDETKTLQWGDIIHDEPAKKLFFFLGTCGVQQPSFNAQYFDVRVRTDALAYKNNINDITNYFQISVQTPPFQVHTLNIIELIECEQTFKLSDKDEMKFNFGDQYSGATEYSISGWSKWKTTSNRDINHFLFRITSNDQNTLTDSTKFGDRVLMAYVDMGTLVFSTYTYDMETEGNANLWQEVEYGLNLNQWFFIYFGYSYQQNLAFAFVKFINSEKVLIFENVWHMIPKHFTIYLGKDPFFQSFNGIMKNWKFRVGTGAFTMMNLEQLHQQQISNYCYDSRNDLLTLSEFPKKNDPNQKVINIPKDTAEKLTHYGFWMWVRFQQNYPQKIEFLQNYKTTCQSVARITEGKQDQSSLGDRNLCVMICSDGSSPVYVFSTYDKFNNSVNVNMTSVIDLSDYEGIWNWIYFAYSVPTKQARGYIYYSYTQTDQLLEFNGVEHNTLVSNIRLLIGQQYNWPGLNGFVDKLQLSLQPGSFMLGKQEINSFFKEKILQPALLMDKRFQNTHQIVTILSKEADFQSDDERKQRSMKLMNYYKFVEEYAVFGSIQWVPPKNRQNKHIVFRLTTNEENKLNDHKYGGDQTLALYIKENQLSFATYLFNIIPDLNFVIDFDINEDKFANQFIWFYMGYSRSLQQLYIQIILKDSKTIDKLVHNVRHINPYYFQIYVGLDPFYNQGAGFNGQIKNLHAVFGKGAYTNDTKHFMSYDSFQHIKNSKQYVEPPQVSEPKGEAYQKEQPQTNFNKQGEPKVRELIPIEGARTEKELIKEDKCAILYSQCNYKGEAFDLCNDHNDLDIPHEIKSIYVPERTKITLYNLSGFQGKKAIFKKSVDCFDTFDFSILLQANSKTPHQAQQSSKRIRAVFEENSETVLKQKIMPRKLLRHNQKKS